MLASRQSNEPVIGRATGDTLAGELAMGGARGACAELKGLGEVLVDQSHRVSRIDTRIAGQTRQHRVRFDQRMPAEPENSALRPLRDHGVARVRGNEKRYRDTRVDGCDRHVLSAVPNR